MFIIHCLTFSLLYFQPCLPNQPLSVGEGPWRVDSTPPSRAAQNIYARNLTSWVVYAKIQALFRIRYDLHAHCPLTASLCSHVQPQYATGEK